MSNPKFYAVDLSIPTFSWSGGAYSGYPVENLNDYILTSVTKSAVMTQNQMLIVDFGYAKEIDHVILDNHNFNALGLSALKIMMANDDAFTEDYTLCGDLTPPFDNLQFVQFGYSRTRQYLGLKFEKSSALSNYPYLGNLFAGLSGFEMSFPYNMDAEMGNKEFKTTVKESLNGIIRTSRQIAGRKRMEVEFTLLSDAKAVEWQTLMDIIQGRLNPFYFKDAADVWHYVHMEEDYIPIKGRRYNVNDLVRLKMRYQLTG